MCCHSLSYNLLVLVEDIKLVSVGCDCDSFAVDVNDVGREQTSS